MRLFRKLAWHWHELLYNIAKINICYWGSPRERWSWLSNIWIICLGPDSKLDIPLKVSKLPVCVVIFMDKCTASRLLTVFICLCSRLAQFLLDFWFWKRTFVDSSSHYYNHQTAPCSSSASRARRGVTAAGPAQSSTPPASAARTRARWGAVIKWS